MEDINPRLLTTQVTLDITYDASFSDINTWDWHSLLDLDTYETVQVKSEDPLASLQESAAQIPTGHRPGQHAFNVLYHAYPRIANSLRGSIIDPFFNNKVLPAFWTFVAISI